METRVRVEKAENIKDWVVPGWGFLNKYDCHHLGRFWVCWKKEELDVTSLVIHKQAIGCRVGDKCGNSWFQNFVYGDINGVERRHLWKF